VPPGRMTPDPADVRDPDLLHLVPDQSGTQDRPVGRQLRVGLPRRAAENDRVVAVHDALDPDDRLGPGGGGLPRCTPSRVLQHHNTGRRRKATPLLAKFRDLHRLLAVGVRIFASASVRRTPSRDHHRKEASARSWLLRGLPDGGPIESGAGSESRTFLR
jgi:hypothetical protein